MEVWVYMIFHLISLLVQELQCLSCLLFVCWRVFKLCPHTPTKRKKELTIALIKHTQLEIRSFPVLIGD